MALNQRVPRSRIEGVRNVVVFNWPKYAVALILLGLTPLIGGALGIGLALAVTIPTAMSLIATHWVYDRSDLYELPWLDGIGLSPRRVLLLHAGFDEIRSFLEDKLPGARIQEHDFFSSSDTPEASIRRARKSGSTAPRDLTGVTHIDLAIAFLSAHELRDSERRAQLFRDAAATLTPGGALVVVEHLRDLPNAIAYSIGVGHFLSRRSWEDTFRRAGLTLVGERTHTPLVHTFILKELP